MVPSEMKKLSSIFTVPFDAGRPQTTIYFTMKSTSIVKTNLLYAKLTFISQFLLFLNQLFCSR